MNNSECAILVPVGGKICSQCESGLRQLETWGYVVKRVTGFSAIDQARNRISSSTLAEGFQETFWIDSDIGFDPANVVGLRNSGLPIACGIYVKKGNRSLACNLRPGTKEVVFGSKGGMLEILYAATGFLYVKKEVYDKIESQLGLPVCNAATAEPFVPYFQPFTVEHNGKHWYLGEDYAFCERARRCGYRIVADTRIRLRHYGEYGYSWEDAGSPVARYETYRYTVAET